MIKLLGGALIVLAAGWMGIAPVVHIKKQINVMEELESALAQMRAELSCCLTPLPELFIKASHSCSGACSDVLRTVGEEMQLQPMATPVYLLRSKIHLLHLQPRENAILLELANALGCYDLDSQLRMLDSAQTKMRQSVNRCQKQIEGKGRSWGTLGICTGLAIAIILV